MTQNRDLTQGTAFRTHSTLPKHRERAAVNCGTTPAVAAKYSSKEQTPG